MISHSPLTPAEALVLIEPHKTKPREALKVSLMALLAQRKLQIDEHKRKGLLGRQISTAHLRANHATGREVAHEASLLQMVRASQPVTMDEFITDAKRSYGADFGGFTTQYVAPSLINRGLLREVVEPFLFLFKRKRLRHTPSGEMERNRLQGLMAQARDIPSFLDSNPQKAAMMAVALGGMVLLIPELQPHLAQLGVAMRNHGHNSDSGSSDHSSSNSSSSSSSSSSSESTAATEQLDLGSFDWGSFDSATLDSVSASMETLDASFDSSSSDSSSDSGGGDSGGGGDGGGGGD